MDKVSECERRNLMLYLIGLGFNQKSKGFRYIFNLIANNDFDSLTKYGVRNISKNAAEEAGCAFPTFERCITRMINSAWNSDCADALRETCSFTPKGYAPTYNEVVTALVITRPMALAFGDSAVSSKTLSAVRELSEERYSAQLENTRDFYDAFPELVVPENRDKLDKLIATEQL